MKPRPMPAIVSPSALRAVIGTFIVGAFFGCASGSPSAAPVAPARPELPSLAVYKVSWHEDDAGSALLDSPFIVVLTRAVEPVPDALALVGRSGAPIDGTTQWVDRQLVAFYPTKPLELGDELHLRLTAPLHTTDGDTLTPRELAHVLTVPIELSSTRVIDATVYLNEGLLYPMGALALGFGFPQPSVDDVQSHGHMSADGADIPFVASMGFQAIEVRAVTGMPPGRDVRFGWKEGAIATLSIGRVELLPIVLHPAQGLVARIGEAGECSMGMTDRYQCHGPTAHIAFGSPIPDSELASHVHPALARATDGDTRRHRLVFTVGKTPRTIVLDAELADSFGQTLGKQRTIEVRTYDPP